MKKFAFTLSEILITLGIIGVVAALTLPTLINNYQKHVWVNQLKKSVSTLEQGFHLMLAQDEVDSLYNTVIFQKIAREDCVMGSMNENPACKEFCNDLKKYFKADYTKHNAKVYGINGQEDYDASNEDWLTLNDGSMAYFNVMLGSDVIWDFFMIDVNGSKKPNRYGRDIFVFSLKDNGKLEPNKAPDCNKTDFGIGCTAKVIENGWKMDY